MICTHWTLPLSLVSCRRTNNSGTPSQLLILQNGKTVWEIGYGDDTAYDLADALNVFAR